MMMTFKNGESFMMRFNPYQLSRELGKSLFEKRWQVAVAESCTGGGLAYAITSVAGASKWFDCGFVTYTDEAKIELLGVNPDTIRHYGEVSPETAIEMANGVIQHSRADIALSITGIAGPTGGSVEKPVGTVCFALALRHNHSVEWRKKLFDSGRKHVRDCSIGFALTWLLQTVKC